MADDGNRRRSRRTVAKRRNSLLSANEVDRRARVGGSQSFPPRRVRWRGLEPPRPRGHKALNLARLPIPPPARGRRILLAPQRPGLRDRHEFALERLAVGLEPCRERELLAERDRRLVDEETGAVGRDLDQDPVG